MSLTTWFYYLPPCFTFTPPSFEVSLSFYVLLPNFVLEIISSCFYILPLVFKSCRLMLPLPPILTSHQLHLPFTNYFLSIPASNVADLEILVLQPIITSTADFQLLCLNFSFSTYFYISVLILMPYRLLSRLATCF